MQIPRDKSKIKTKPDGRGGSHYEKRCIRFCCCKTHELIDSPTCSPETREAANAWLNAVETENEAEETKKYIAELEEDIMPIDTLIGFAESEAGAQVFGTDKAKDVAAHAKEIKSNGAKYCDCPACAAVAAILEKKDQL